MTIAAASRHDLSALVKVRKALEEGNSVTVWFPDESKVQFTPADLQGVIWKITCNM